MIKNFWHNPANPYFMHVSRIVFISVQLKKDRAQLCVKHGKKCVKRAWLRAFFEFLTIRLFRVKI
jgi:hypothetical protein